MSLCLMITLETYYGIFWYYLCFIGFSLNCIEVFHARFEPRAFTQLCPLSYSLIPEFSLLKMFPGYFSRVKNLRPIGLVCIDFSFGYSPKVFSGVYWEYININNKLSVVSCFYIFDICWYFKILGYSKHTQDFELFITNKLHVIKFCHLQNLCVTVGSISKSLFVFRWYSF